MRTSLTDLEEKMLKYFDTHRNGKRNAIHNLNQVKSSNWYVFNIKMLDKGITEPMFFHEFSSFADAYDFFLNKMELFKNLKSEENLANFRLANGSDIYAEYFSKD